jgi:hypothetical protein
MELLVVFGFTFLTTVVILLTIGGVILLRPISRHLGEYLEAKAEEGRFFRGRSPEEVDRLLSLMEGVTDRLERMEERQAFTEQLLLKPGRGGGEE